MNFPDPPEDAKVWRLMEVATGRASQQWWVTEDEAMIACSRLTSPGIETTNCQGRAWVVISDEPCEPGNL